MTRTVMSAAAGAAAGTAAGRTRAAACAAIAATEARTTVPAQFFQAVVQSAKLVDIAILFGAVARYGVVAKLGLHGRDRSAAHTARARTHAAAAVLGAAAAFASVLGKIENIADNIAVVREGADGGDITVIAVFGNIGVKISVETEERANLEAVRQTLGLGVARGKKRRPYTVRTRAAAFGRFVQNAVIFANRGIKASSSRCRKLI